MVIESPEKMAIADPCWEPDDQTLLNDPTFRFPAGYLTALGRALARDHPEFIHRDRRRYMDRDTVARFFGVGDCTTPTSKEASESEHGGAEDDDDDDDSGADREAALEEGWNDIVCSIDQLLHEAGEEDAEAMARQFSLEEGVVAVAVADTDSSVGCTATAEAAEYGGTEDDSSEKGQIQQEEPDDYVLVGTAEEIERERQQEEAALEDDGCDKKKQQQAAVMAAWNSLVQDIEPPLEKASLEVVGSSCSLVGWSEAIQQLWDVAAPKAAKDLVTAAEWDDFVRGDDSFLREEAAIEAQRKRNGLVVPAMERQFFWVIDENYLIREEAALQLVEDDGPGRNGQLVPFFDNDNPAPADERCFWDIDDEAAGVPDDDQVADDYGGAICDGDYGGAICNDDYFRVPEIEAGDGAVGGSQISDVDL